MTIDAEIARIYGLDDVQCSQLDVFTNDVFDVSSVQGRFAFKLYNQNSRSQADVQWELALIDHMLKRDAPVAPAVSHNGDAIQNVSFDGRETFGVLFEWAHGEKPPPTLETYALLGDAAARIHAATDDFPGTTQREIYDRRELIDDQLARMEPLLRDAEQWDAMRALGHRLSKFLDNVQLDWGICHMDLTLDNVHRDADKMTVFDFDSAGACWRAIEPHGVLLASATHFNAWVESYREVRQFDASDEHAVRVFCIIGEIRNVAWKLGVAKSSRGTPLMAVSDIPTVVDEWLNLEQGLA